MDAEKWELLKEDRRIENTNTVTLLMKVNFMNQTHNTLKFGRKPLEEKSMKISPMKLLEDISFLRDLKENLKTKTENQNSMLNDYIEFG